VKIRPSTTLRNEYLEISALAKETGEPIFITNKGEADGVFLSVKAFEEREKMFRHRESVLAAEFARLSGEAVFTADEIHGDLERLYEAGQ